MNLILVEDDLLEFEIFSSIIEAYFPEITAIQISDKDIERINDYNPNDSMVLLDLNLNGKDGLGIFLSHIRQLKFTTFVHTSSDNPRDIERCKDAGIYGYFQKPTGKNDIKDLIETVTKFYQRNLLKTVSFTTINERYLSEINELKKDNANLTQENSKLRNPD